MQAERDLRSREITKGILPRPDGIVVPLDGSPRAAIALAIAEELAKVEHATLHVCFLDSFLQEKENEQARNLRIEIPNGSVVHRCNGDAAESIISLTDELPHALIVISTHRYGERIGGVLGPLAAHLLRHSSNPAILVPLSVGDRPWHMHRIVFAHDGSPSTDVAVHAASALALRAGAKFVALHVADSSRQTSEELGTVSAPLYLDQPQHEWPAWVREFAERMRALGHPEQVRTHIVVTGGQPDAEILHYTREHSTDLLVLAWRGHTEPERSQTVRKVLTHSHCPVLILRVDRDQPQRFQSAA